MGHTSQTTTQLVHSTDANKYFNCF